MTNQEVRDVLKHLEEKRAQKTSTVGGSSYSNLDRVVGGKKSHQTLSIDPSKLKKHHYVGIGAELSGGSLLGNIAKKGIRTLGRVGKEVMKKHGKDATKYLMEMGKKAILDSGMASHLVDSAADFATNKISGLLGNGTTGGAKKQGELLGRQYAEAVMKDESLKGGESFWDGFKRGFNMVMKPAAGVAKAVAPLAGPYGEAAKGAIEAVGYGSVTGGESFWDGFKRGFNMVMKPAAGVAKAVAPVAGPYGMAASAGLSALGYGKKPKQKRALSEKQKKRNAMVRQLMKENGMSLPQASKYIKENGLI